ncbi:MAG TPA: glycogen debranching N-terminal domain-containing protein [Gemmatimonadales bacterium]|nr:glycogen debranching N-terminal domain-containing protein [Gemmatimonadales bacterium]
MSPTSPLLGGVMVRPGLRYAWYGPSLLITDSRGECGGDEGLTGLYFRETRFLRDLRLEIDGQRPWLCASGTGEQHVLAFGFSHPELRRYTGGGSGTGGQDIPRDRHGVPDRALDLLSRYELSFRGLDVTVVITNRSTSEVAVDLAWYVGADFADLMEALGGGPREEFRFTESLDGGLCFRLDQPDLGFSTRVSAAGAGPWTACPGTLVARVTLPPQQPQTVRLRVTAHDPEPIPDARGEAARRESVARWRDRVTRFRAPGDRLAERLVGQAVDDLGSFALLEGDEEEWLAPAAGLPLYPALFGRDSLTVTWQAALFDRGRLLEATLTRLRRLQGTRDDPHRDEQPGRIIHSLRRGPLARTGRNPYARYYGDYASPLMFVVALAHLYAWTGEKADVKRHWDAARRALDWARERGDGDGDGYLEYQTLAEQGPKNQGWKDSGEGILYADGRPVPAPIATCEVQGYWFAAQQLSAVLAAVQGCAADAKDYWRSAMDLKRRFNRDWWMPEEEFVALALDPDKAQVRSVGSNAGHCLTAGIIADDHLPAVVGRLFAPEMFSGWGIRTLASTHPAYNPIGYHLGSIWPVENATIGFGLRRYGFDARFLDLMEAMLDLAGLYPGGRVPECVGGYARAEFPHPGAYPQANTPQAWNQSALPLLVHSVLGLQPVAALDLLVVDPVLPSWLPEVTLEGIRIGGATATLRFHRDNAGESHVEVVRKRGTLHVVKQPPPESLTARPRDRLTALADRLLHH